MVATRSTTTSRPAPAAGASARPAKPALHGGETVHLPEEDRGTLCVSAQVGCTLTCSFCHTGTQKLVRNLTAEEILTQLMTARDRLTHEPAADEAASPAPGDRAMHGDREDEFSIVIDHRRHRLDHGRQFSRGKVHINGLEGFWAYAKGKLLKHHGVSPARFPLYLYEWQFRYNHRREDLFNLLLTTALKLVPDPL